MLPLCTSRAGSALRARYGSMTDTGRARPLHVPTASRHVRKDAMTSPTTAECQLILCKLLASRACTMRTPTVLGNIACGTQSWGDSRAQRRLCSTAFIVNWCWVAGWCPAGAGRGRGAYGRAHARRSTKAGTASQTHFSLVAQPHGSSTIRSCGWNLHARRPPTSPVRRCWPTVRRFPASHRVQLCCCGT